MHLQQRLIKLVNKLIILAQNKYISQARNKTHGVTLFKDGTPSPPPNKKKMCEEISLNLKPHVLATKINQYNKFLSYVKLQVLPMLYGGQVEDRTFKVNS